MKNSKIMTAWDKIEPDDAAKERMLSAILARNRPAHERKEKVLLMSHTKKTKRIWIPVAACLAALIAVTGIVGINLNWFDVNNTPDNGVGVDGTVMPGGDVPDGVDPVVASIAVYPPADKSLADVADASCNEITEEEAYRFEGLGEHLPETVAEGYRFRNASLYETIMKDGSRYCLLRVDFTTGDENIADYSVQLTSYEPQTEDAILTPDAIPKDIAEAGFFHFVCGGVYYGMDPGELTYEEIMSVINSIH